MSAAFALDRRGVLTVLAASAASPAFAGRTSHSPVVFIHHDQPAMDATGRAPAYQPSRAPPARLPDAAFDRLVFLCSTAQWAAGGGSFANGMPSSLGRWFSVQTYSSTDSSGARRQ